MKGYQKMINHYEQDDEYKAIKNDIKVWQIGDEEIEEKAPCD